ncbi:MAG: ABC transporter permease [Terracidiphilus sp.]
MRLFSFLRRKSELIEEIESHLNLAIADRIARGQSPADARKSAMRELGNAPLIADVTRDQWKWLRLELWMHDVRYAMRQLRKSPGFTFTAIITLALGVGANTTVFSMINGLLLRPLAVPASDRLVVIGMDTDGPRRNYSFPESIFRGIESRHEAFTDVFAFDHDKFQVKSGSGNELVPGQFVSGSFFRELQTPPLLGRTLTPEDDRTGGNPNGFGVVIGESYWITRFNRAPDVIGRKLEIDRVVFTVVGVMPRRFIGGDPLQRPQIFVPLATEPVVNRERSLTAYGYHAWWLTVMGRLQPGVTLEKANAQVAAITGAVMRAKVPDAKWIANREKYHFRFAAEPGSTGANYVRMSFRKPLVAVFAMCGGILLLACLNLASLLLARGTARQRELATRMAMGASRGRLIQQLLVEGLLLGMIGSLAGLAIAPVVSKSLAAMLLTGGNGMVLDTSLDVRVFGFAALAAIVATLLFALAPAIQATSRALIDRIKDGQHATQTRERRGILPRVLLGVEVGLALMLVVGAGLLASSLVRLYTSNLGFDPRGVQNIAFNMDKLGLKNDALMAFYREMGDRLQHQPGVKSVSFAQMVPLTGYQWDENFPDPAGADHDIYMNSVAPRYFDTMRIPIFAGRDFTWNDTKAEVLKIVLNQSAAKLLAPDGNVLGRTVKNHDGDKLVSYQVVGVVGDAKYTDLRTPAPPTAYVPMTQAEEHMQSYQAVVRIDGSAAPLALAARTLVTQMAPSIPAPEMTSMETIVDESLASERMMALLSVFFAICALAVTAVGLYGTLAYATARRTSEIGIRMALGARRAQVAQMVFGQNLWVVLGGTIFGLAAALMADRALASFLYLTSTRDPWVIAGSLLALAVIACAASLLPALRAARIEPMSAIRCE